MLKRRYEFVGKDEENCTVFGHVFASGINGAIEYCDEHKINPRIVGICGLLPEEPIACSYELIEILLRYTNGNPELFHQFNRELLDPDSAIHRIFNDV